MQKDQFYSSLGSLFQERKQKVKFWLRDDDAIENTMALDRLIGICNKNQFPLFLAVIPKLLKKEMNLKAHHSVYILQHGFQHKSRALEGQKKCEFPEHVAEDIIKEELLKGFETLENHFGEQFLPVFVPPWNRFADNHKASLKTAGFKFLSVYGNSKNSFYANTHFDIINWRGDRDFIGYEGALELLTQLIKERETLNEPIGILTHHLDHTEKIWSFLDEFLSYLNQNEKAEIIAADELFKY